MCLSCLFWPLRKLNMATVEALEVSSLSYENVDLFHFAVGCSVLCRLYSLFGRISFLQIVIGLVASFAQTWQVPPKAEGRNLTGGNSHSLPVEQTAEEARCVSQFCSGP